MDAVPRGMAPAHSVAVVIATYNRVNILARALFSVLQQTWKDWHLFVIGDGCTDGTADFLRNFQATFPSISWENSTENQGRRFLNTGAPAKQRGLQLALAQGYPWTAFLDDDNEWLPNHLELLLSQRTPQAGLIWSDMEYVQPNTGKVVKRHHSSGPPRIGSIDSSEMLVRTALALEVGGWTQGFPLRERGKERLRVDDWWLAHRLVEAGHAWVHVPQVSVRYWDRRLLPPSLASNPTQAYLPPTERFLQRQ